MKLEISKDRKYAHLSINPNENLTLEAVVKYLKMNNVNSGIDQKAIEKALSSKSEDSFLVASFLAEKGTDDLLKILVDTTIAPQEKNNRLNYYDLSYVKDIKKDQQIFEYIAGEEYQEGKLVDGSLFSENKRDFKRIRIAKMINENCYLVEKEGKILGFSKINGSYRINDKRIIVTDKLKIHSNVNFVTGNLISEYSSFEISGSVMNNFILKTTKDIKIKGNLENSSINCQNLEIEGLIAKGDKLIFCQNDLKSQKIIGRENLYAHNLWVKTNIMDSKIGVYNFAKIGEINGCEFHIYNHLEVDILGGHNKTEIFLSSDKYQLDQTAKINKEIKTTRKDMKMMLLEIEKVKTSLFKLMKNEAENQSEIKKLGEDRDWLDEDYKKFQQLEQNLIAKFAKLAQRKLNFEAKITVNHKLKTNTAIYFGENMIRTNKEYGPCEIVIGDEGAIEILTN